MYPNRLFYYRIKILRIYKKMKPKEVLENG